jgi:hypothetical protein
MERVETDPDNGGAQPSKIRMRAQRKGRLAAASLMVVTQARKTQLPANGHE